MRERSDYEQCAFHEMDVPYTDGSFGCRKGFERIHDVKTK